MLCLTLWEIAEDPDAFMARKAALLRVFLICLVMSLLRHNAVFAVLPAVLAVIILCRGARKKAAALCAVTMLFCFGAPRCLQYATHAKALLSSELMSVPCQQLMRMHAHHNIGGLDADHQVVIAKVFDHMHLIQRTLHKRLRCHAAIFF